MLGSPATPVPSPARFWLGMLQMAGAAFALALFVSSGVSTLTIVATLVTTLIALAGLLLRRGTLRHHLDGRPARRAQN